ncbi:hypothetical protein ACMBCN_01505 [Candidatus Liberibacter asiaticus]|nr:hypothetical protein [Candidatus Liberibacter asiaticus]
MQLTFTMGDNITVFKIQTLNSQPQNPIHTISFSLFFFSLFFTSAEKKMQRVFLLLQRVSEIL